MKPVLSVMLVSLALGGCGEPPTGSSAAMIAAVRLGDVYYTIADHPAGTGHAEGERVATVVRLVDCSEGIRVDENTHISDACILADRESNFLPAGTSLYRVAGAGPESLIAHPSGDGFAERVLLQRVESR